MNYLAHTLLAGGDADLEVGGILGDFVHGHLDAVEPAGLRAGVALHRAVDIFTDSHPVVRAARARFRQPFRRYAGILLDMWFDHCLALDFGRWSGLPLERFSVRLRDRLQRHRSGLPPAMQRFMAYMQIHDLPAGYADTAILAEALAGIGRRLSRPNPLAAAVPVMVAREDELRDSFRVFFPELTAFAARWRVKNRGQSRISSV